MRATRLALTAALTVLTLVSATESRAATILSGNSNPSSFSNCVGTGCSADGLQTITLGSTAPGGSSSTLTIVPYSFLATGQTTGLGLAGLSLTVGQKPGSGEGTLRFDNNIVLAFTIPGSTTFDTIDLSLQGNGGSGSNAEVTLAGLMPPFTDPLNLGNGLILTNFRFIDIGSAGYFWNGMWTVDGKGNSATLELLADVIIVGPGASIPEPSSIVLVGSALAALGVIRKRRKV